MKKLILSILILLGGIFSVSAQLRTIPAAVTDALKSRYPNATGVSWKDRLSYFVANFGMDNQKYEARFTENGEWKSTEKAIEEDQLPDNVKDGFSKSKYADWEMKEFYLIELPDDVVEYRVHIAKNDVQKKNLLFSNEGQLIKDNITLK